MNDNNNGLSFCILLYLIQAVSNVGLFLAVGVATLIGLRAAGSVRARDARLTDEHDLAMMGDDGSGSAFARQRARASYHRYHALSSNVTALPPAKLLALPPARA